MAAVKKQAKATKAKAPREGAPGKPSLTSVTLQGFKSFRDETRIAIRPLTLLAGANSSGKSSAIQPLLLLKQTLEAPYDPGPLLLNGPNVSFSMGRQILWQGAAKGDRAGGWLIGLTRGDETVRLFFRGAAGGRLEVEKIAYAEPHVKYDVRPSMRGAEASEIIDAISKHTKAIPRVGRRALTVRVERSHCILKALVRMGGDKSERYTIEPFSVVLPVIRGLIHLPGLRGNPERNYQTAAVDNVYPGLFQKYVASVLASWKEAGDARLDKLDAAVSALGLTWKIEPHRIDDVSIEIRVGRLPSRHKGRARDLVNIADVGFGVSQTLPVVVALLAAAPGQVVYLEQPEIHLHPRAQVALARLLLDAAKRGVVVIAETHSDLLLRSVQRAVAAGEVDPSLVTLHWFERDEDGATKVTTAELDTAGTYGDWPVDFAEVDLKLEGEFLDASLRHSA